MSFLEFQQKNTLFGKTNYIMFHYSLRVIDEPKMSEIRILKLCHKKSIFFDIYRQSLLIRSTLAEFSGSCLHLQFTKREWAKRANPCAPWYFFKIYLKFARMLRRLFLSVVSVTRVVYFQVSVTIFRRQTFEVRQPLLAELSRARSAPAAEHHG